jgi:hypothetical protein
MALVCVTAAILLAVGAMLGRVPQAAAFFGSGALLLAACLLAMGCYVTRIGHAQRAMTTGRGRLLRLGLRNATRQPRRSMLIVGVVACATFILVAVGANRQVVTASSGVHSGTGGYALVAESTAPILQDLNTPAGQDVLRISPQTRDLLKNATIVPMRLRVGDDASCANLYRPRTPRILGATDAMIRRGGFRFAGSSAATPDQRDNPWLLLTTALPDSAVPAIGDESTVVWLLHSGLGKDLSIADDLGRPMRLRFVGMLAGSMLQSEIVIGEPAFREHFPAVSGYSFFMIDVPTARADRATGNRATGNRATGSLPASAPVADLQRALSADLGDYGLDVQRAEDRLAGYIAIENTYISAFELLGGLGMVLGTFGLTAVLLRNVLERRRELALLQAVGYGRRAIATILLAENIGLMLAGLAAGLVSALLTAIPHLRTDAADVPWAVLASLLAAVVVLAVLTGAITLAIMLRGPLLPALRND